MTGSVSFEIDPATGMFLGRAVGMATPEVTTAHFDRMEIAVRHARQAGHTIRVLMDLREAPVQTPETAAALKAGGERIHRAGDRIAFLCNSALMTMQLKRNNYPGAVAVFSDRDEAVDWLLSDAPPPTSR